MIWQSRATPWGLKNKDLVLYAGEFFRISLMVSQNIALIFNIGRWFVVLETLKEKERDDLTIVLLTRRITLKCTLITLGLLAINGLIYTLRVTENS